MKYLILAICLLTLAWRCNRADTPPDPKVAALIGTWLLMTPDSAAGTTITFSLDTANPPHDITAFDVQGQGLQNAYSGRMYATIDGTIQIQQIATTDVGGTTTARKTDLLYQTKLQSVARYEQLADKTLRLYFGKPTAGVLNYRKY